MLCVIAMFKRSRTRSSVMNNFIHHASRIVVLPFALLVRVIGQWTAEYQSGLDLLVKGKDFSARMEGFSLTKRVDAKFLLLASIPIVIPIFVREQVGNFALFNVFIGIGIVWGVVIFSLGTRAYCKWFCNNRELYRRGRR